MVTQRHGQTDHYLRVDATNQFSTGNQKERLREFGQFLTPYGVLVNPDILGCFVTADSSLFRRISPVDSVPLFYLCS